MLKTRMMIGLFLIVGAFSACKKDSYDAEKQAKIDDGLIVDFIAKNSIVAIKHSSGLYYQILNAGSGNEVMASNTVSVNYQGKLLDGFEFDKSTTPTSFSLAGNLIQGWKIGVPLIKKGGKIRLLIPSALAYKNTSPGAGIPQNAVLDFTIELITVQ